MRRTQLHCVPLKLYNPSGHVCQLMHMRPKSSACRFALVEPVESHTKLSVSQEGLEALRSIPGPVVPVVVIGPYRSGKSFLLNQLLGVGCSEPHTASCVHVLGVSQP